MKRNIVNQRQGTLVSTGHKRRGAHRRQRRGAAMLEFALVLPILMLVVFGIIEFGRAYSILQVLTNGASVGARTAGLAGSTDAQVDTAVASYLASASVPTGYTTTVTPSSTTATTGTMITVTVSIPFSKIYSAADYVGLQGKTLTTSVVMRHE